MSTAASSIDRRRALADLVRERGGKSGAGRPIRLTLLLLLLAAVVVPIALWLTGFFSTPKELLELRGMVDQQVNELRKVARNEAALSFDSPGFGAVMDRVRDMPEGMRRKAGRDVGRLFEARERAEIDSYFGLPPGRRQAEIDRRIQADEARRKAREAERSRRDEQGGGQRPTGQAQGGPPGPGTGGGATGNAPARGGRMVTEDDRNARSKSRIDRTSPDARARQTEYRRVIDERRKQLGLPPRPGRG